MLASCKIYITFLPKRRITKEDKEKSYRFGFSPVFLILVFFISVFIMIRLIALQKEHMFFFLTAPCGFQVYRFFFFYFSFHFCTKSDLSVSNRKFQAFYPIPITFYAFWLRCASGIFSL